MKKINPWVIMAILAFAFCVVMLMLHLFTGFDLAFQMVAACLGAVITALITAMLLKEQSKQQILLNEREEAKDKNIKIYESKIAVYSDFVSKMWKTIEDDIVEEQELRDLRGEAFRKLVFYLNNKNISVLAETVAQIKLYYPNDENADIPTIRRNNITAFSEITKILQDDLKQDEQDKADASSITKLWLRFNLAPIEDKQNVLANHQTQEPVIQTQSEVVQSATDTIISEVEDEEPQYPHVLKKQTWHFNAWDANKQIKALANGLKELSLVEYDGEVWRTNLVKQVNLGDIAFLFRTGGAGYIGAYEVTGWRVFTKEGNSWKEVIKNADGKREITDQAQVMEDLAKSDIYGSANDGSSSVANLIVNPIVQCKNWGVSYPGGVYRRTISRYDSGYAWTLMSRLLRVDAGVKTVYDQTLFDKIIADNHVVPAVYEEGKGWI